MISFSIHFIQSLLYLIFQEKEKVRRKIGQDGSECSKDFSTSMYSCLLKNEIFGTQIEHLKETSDKERRAFAPISDDRNNLFSYRPQRPSVVNEPSSPYSLSPVSSKSEKLLRSPRKVLRKIAKVPFRVLDAPELKAWADLRILA